MLHYVGGDQRSPQVPVGYMLTNKLNADVVKQATKALGRVEECRARELRLNYSAIKQLGAEYRVEVDDFDPYFDHPTTGDRIYVFPVHNLKPLRNALKAYHEFESNGEVF